MSNPSGELILGRIFYSPVHPTAVHPKLPNLRNQIHILVNIRHDECNCLYSSHGQTISWE